MKHAAVLIALASTPAAARDFCPDRPDRVQSACVTETGAVEAEASIADWALTDRPGRRDETLLVGDVLIRTGLTRSVEARVGFTSYGYTRMRDEQGVQRDDSLGDVTFGLRWNLRNPDGHGLSVALQPTVSFPTGGDAIGAGAWGFTLALPASADLGHGVALVATPVVSAAQDEDRRGQHLAYSGALALRVPLGARVHATAGLFGSQDRDPQAHASRASADLALAWRIAPALQFDAGTYVGLTPDTPDVQLVVGVAHRF